MKLIGKTKRYALIVALIALMGIIALFAATPVRQVSAEETAYPVVFQRTIRSLRRNTTSGTSSRFRTGRFRRAAIQRRPRMC